MSVADDQELLRDAREGVRGTPPELVQGGNLALVGTVTTPDASIALDGVFAVARERVAGVASVGATPAFSAFGGPDTRVANLGGRYPRNGQRVIADHVNYGWVWQEPGCAPCDLRRKDLQLIFSYASGYGLVPYTLISRTIPLTLATGTQPYLYQNGVPGAPQARDGWVWRSACQRFDDAFVNSASGVHSYLTGDHYDCVGPFSGGTVSHNEYINWIVEAFCNGSSLQVIFNGYLVDNAPSCAVPAASCAGFPGVINTYIGTGGRYSFPTAGAWNPDPTFFWIPDVPATSCGPLHAAWTRTIQESSGTPYDDLVLVEAP
jgi:hypothetical protein